MTISPRLSFKGYNFGTALYRNKDTIKGIIALLSGVNFAIGFNWKTFGITLAAAFAGLGVKLLSDAIDFYFGNVEIPDNLIKV